MVEEEWKNDVWVSELIRATDRVMFDSQWKMDGTLTLGTHDICPTPSCELMDIWKEKNPKDQIEKLNLLIPSKHIMWMTSPKKPKSNLRFLRSFTTYCEECNAVVSLPVENAQYKMLDMTHILNHCGRRVAEYPYIAFCCEACSSKGKK